MQCESVPYFSLHRAPTRLKIPKGKPQTEKRVKYSRSGMKTIIFKTPEELGTALRMRRKELKLTIAEVADMVGCSSRFISEAERGTSSASIGLILQLGQELGLKFATNIRL